MCAYKKSHLQTKIVRLNFCHVLFLIKLKMRFNINRKNENAVCNYLTLLVFVKDLQMFEEFRGIHKSASSMKRMKLGKEIL